MNEMDPTNGTPMFRNKTIFALVIVAATFASCSAQEETEQEWFWGDWTMSLNVGSEEQPDWLDFGVQVAHSSPWFLINGEERIEMPDISYKDTRLELHAFHYASKVVVWWDPVTDTLSGEWTKRRGKDNDAVVPVIGSRPTEQPWEDPSKFVGRWSVHFADSEDPAVGVFEKAEGSNQVLGTFLTTTGDYRYLAGGVRDGRLQLSCFDGAHAFLFRADVGSDGSLTGTFKSGNWYETQWTARLDAEATLPDAFTQTVWTDKVALSELRFPDLDGNVVALDDERFAGKCRIIEVFGSWCPNCHDAGVYLSELHEKYGDRGLSITGLAFELTGDFETDVAQVRRFADRNDTAYPMLIAGTSDKGEATEQLQVLDRVRSYPTMIFLDAGGHVKAIYTGFSGPATGEAHRKLREQFEAIIEELLDE
ncbi:MAG: TlpA family protein disulfide reductase [Pirellulaceae bacterium]